MDVILVEPCFPRNQREFARALHSVGARVIGIGERPKEALDDSLRHWLTHYEQVSNVCDEAALEKAVRFVQSISHPERLEATVEAHIQTAAQVRERCGIPGTSAKTAFLCRDKPSMKEVLRQAGVPCAASTGTGSPDEARAFAARVGYPLILKPRDGAGAAGTFRVDDDVSHAVSHTHAVHTLTPLGGFIVRSPFLLEVSLLNLAEMTQNIVSNAAFSRSFFDARSSRSVMCVFSAAWGWDVLCSSLISWMLLPGTRTAILASNVRVLASWGDPGIH